MLVGRPDWVLSQLPEPSRAPASFLQQSAAADAAAGKSTQVYVAVGDQLLGGLGFRDSLRQDAVETVAALKRMGLRVFLLSGDDTATVKAVAAQAGIAAGDAYGSNTPGQKLAVIRELQVRPMFGFPVRTQDSSTGCMRCWFVGVKGSNTDELCHDLLDVWL